MSNDQECRTFTRPPVTKPFPPTGALFYRVDEFKSVPMTIKEWQFEKLSNEKQAEHDVFSDVREWKRLKELEEQAILLFHEVGEDLEEFSRQMQTRDQMEMEFQCQRKKQKAEDLNRKKSEAAVEELKQNRLKTEAGEKARDQERIRNDFAANVRASFQASSDPWPI